MRLLKDEEIISYSANGDLRLTNMRLRYHVKSDGADLLSSMFLNQLAFIEMRSKRRSVLLRSAIVGLLIGVYFFSNNKMDVSLLFFGAGLALLVFYLLSRTYQLAFVSTGSKSIEIKIKGMKSKDVLGFIDLVEQTAFELIGLKTAIAKSPL